MMKYFSREMSVLSYISSTVLYLATAKDSRMMARSMRIITYDIITDNVV